MNNWLEKSWCCVSNGHKLEEGLRAVYMPRKRAGRILEIRKTFTDYIIKMAFDDGATGSYHKGDIRPEVIL